MIEEFKKSNIEKEILDSLQNNPTKLGNEKYLKIKEIITTRKFPEDWFDVDYNTFKYIDNVDHDDWNMQFRLREYYVENIGFVIITDNFLNELAKYISNKKCLEIMCGKGSLSYGLRQKGIDIIATDNLSWEIAKNNLWLNDIEDIDAIYAVEKYGKDVGFIICSWPPMDSDMRGILLKMREINPDCKLIFIGEGYGGCCANDRFFDIVNYIDDKNFESIHKYIYQWYGIHDTIYLMN